MIWPSWQVAAAAHYLGAAALSGRFTGPSRRAHLIRPLCVGVMDRDKIEWVLVESRLLAGPGRPGRATWRPAKQARPGALASRHQLVAGPLNKLATARWAPLAWPSQRAPI